LLKEQEQLSMQHTSPDTLTGLMAAIQYDFYVTAICGPGDTAFTVGPVTITTPCAVLLRPGVIIWMRVRGWLMMWISVL
jgi:hypothetical protein